MAFIFLGIINDDVAVCKYDFIYSVSYNTWCELNSNCFTDTKVLAGCPKSLYYFEIEKNISAIHL